MKPTQLYYTSNPENLCFVSRSQGGNQMWKSCLPGSLKDERSFQSPQEASLTTMSVEAESGLSASHQVLLFTHLLQQGEFKMALEKLQTLVRPPPLSSAPAQFSELSQALPRLSRGGPEVCPRCAESSPWVMLVVALSSASSAEWLQPLVTAMVKQLGPPSSENLHEDVASAGGEHFPHNWISVAASQQKLSVVWPLLYGAGVRENFSLHDCCVWREDYDALSAEHQKCFQLSDQIKWMKASLFTVRLRKLCNGTSSHVPSLPSVIECVQVGADVSLQVFRTSSIPGNPSLLCFLLRGLPDHFIACLQTTRAVDFTQVNSRGQSVLHVLVDSDTPLRRRDRERCVVALARRLDAIPGLDQIQWELQSSNGDDFLATAAKSGLFSAVIPHIQNCRAFQRFRKVQCTPLRLTIRQEDLDMLPSSEKSSPLPITPAVVENHPPLPLTAWSLFEQSEACETLQKRIALLNDQKPFSTEKQKNTYSILRLLMQHFHAALCGSVVRDILFLDKLEFNDTVVLIGLASYWRNHFPLWKTHMEHLQRHLPSFASVTKECFYLQTGVVTFTLAFFSPYARTLEVKFVLPWFVEAIGSFAPLTADNAAEEASARTPASSSGTLLTPLEAVQILMGVPHLDFVGDLYPSVSFSPLLLATLHMVRQVFKNDSSYLHQFLLPGSLRSSWWSIPLGILNYGKQWEWDSDAKSVYYGEKKMGRRHGVGVRASFQSQLVYVGQWKDGRPNGEGRVYEWALHGNALRRIFEGHFLNGVKEGHGEYYFEDGGVYCGEYHEDERSGQGRLTYATTAHQEGMPAQRCFFDGKWSKGEKHGPGVQLFDNYTVYEGHYCKDRRHGEGRQYILEYRDKIHSAAQTSMERWLCCLLPPGCDKVFFLNYSGLWEEDQLKRGTYYWADGARYEGEFLHNARHGQGRMTYANKLLDIYDGNWKMGEPTDFIGESDTEEDQR